MEKRKVSTFLANEEKKRLPKSGKDTDRRLLKKDPDVFLKRRDVLPQTPRRF